MFPLFSSKRTVFHTAMHTQTKDSWKKKKKKACLHEAILKRFPVYLEMPETTGDYYSLVPLPGLVWHRMFTPWMQKKLKNTWSMLCFKKQQLTHNSNTTWAEGKMAQEKTVGQSADPKENKFKKGGFQIGFIVFIFTLLTVHDRSTSTLLCHCSLLFAICLVAVIGKTTG